MEVVQLINLLHVISIFVGSIQVPVGPLIRLDQDNYLQRNIYPYLMYGTGGSDLWIIGRGGVGVTTSAFYATHILHLAPFDCVLHKI